MKENWLYGKTIVLTGASSGLGRVMSETFVNEYDCHVIGVARNEQKCKKLQDSLPAGKFEYFLFDVGDETAWKIFAKELETRGTECDVLINNAGMLPPFCRLEGYQSQTAEAVTRTNYLSVVYACTALLPLVKRSPCGAIFNVASSAALCPLPGATLYEGSKAAVKNFTESLAAEYKNEKPHVGVLFPGFTMTDIFRAQPSDRMQDARIEKFAAPCEKTVKKIVKAIVKRARRKTIGWDAKGMALLYALFPSRAAFLCGKVLRRLRVSLFDDVFTE